MNGLRPGAYRRPAWRLTHDRHCYHAGIAFNEDRPELLGTVLSDVEAWRALPGRRLQVTVLGELYPC